MTGSQRETAGHARLLIEPGLKKAFKRLEIWKQKDKGCGLEDARLEARHGLVHLTLVLMQLPKQSLLTQDCVQHPHHSHSTSESRACHSCTSLRACRNRVCLAGRSRSEREGLRTGWRALSRRHRTVATAAGEAVAVAGGGGSRESGMEDYCTYPERGSDSCS